MIIHEGVSYTTKPAPFVNGCMGCAFHSNGPGCVGINLKNPCDGVIFIRADAKTQTESTKPSNPKDAIGDKKVPLWLLSPIAKAHWALAQFCGMCKYQAWNWRIAGVRSSTYLSAIGRHMDAYVSGEELDPTDGTHHLGNIMACCAILLDAEAAGKLNDDRPPVVSHREAYAAVEAQMEVLRAKYKHIPQKPFTIKDANAAMTA